MTVDDQIAKLQELLRRLLASQPPASGEPTENHETVATPSETKEVLPPAPSEPALPQPQALESRSRLLSAPIALDDEKLDELSQDDVSSGLSAPARARDSSALRIGVTDITEPDDAGYDELGEPHEQEKAAANEIEEPAPSSSRRPIVSEAPSPGETSDDAPPRYTPPPESGKQVAAVPVIERALIPDVSTPSDSWSSPEITAVRRSSAPEPGAPPAPGPLSLEISRPAIAPSDNVASIVSAPPVLRAATFGELLDATLEL